MRILFVTNLLVLFGAAACLAESPAERLLGDLRAELPAVRRQAAAALGQLADRATVPGLVVALDDPEAPVRREAAKSLGNLKDERSVPGLIESLADHDAKRRSRQVRHPPSPGRPHLYRGRQRASGR
jgi:HEAT repeat protein